MIDELEEKTYESCPVCSSSIKKWKTKKVGKSIYKIDLCNSCGYAFVNPRPSLKFLMNYYSSYEHEYNRGNGSEETPTINSVLAQEKEAPNSTIDAKRLIGTIRSLNSRFESKKFLDVGCGYGFFSREAMNNGFEVIPLELAENERKITKEMTGSNPIASSFEDFNYAPSSLSVVFMSQILEHALDINLWIYKANSMLEKNGILAIALPNFGSIFRLLMQENEPYICPPAHLNFFNHNSLTCLLEKHGFRVEKIQWITRIPKRTFEKRMPRIGRPILPIVNFISQVSCKTLDYFHLGMMINVYGRKVNT